MNPVVPTHEMPGIEVTHACGQKTSTATVADANRFWCPKCRDFFSLFCDSFAKRPAPTEPAQFAKAKASEITRYETAHGAITVRTTSDKLAAHPATVDWQERALGSESERDHLRKCLDTSNGLRDMLKERLYEANARANRLADECGTLLARAEKAERERDKAQAELHRRKR